MREYLVYTRLLVGFALLYCVLLVCYLFRVGPEKILNFLELDLD